MDDRCFDYLTRTIGEQTDRRGMMKTAAGGALAMLGMKTLSQAALGQDVSSESKGFKGDKCKNNNDCKKGLKCNKNKNKCEYQSGCGGKKNQACQNSKDCCKGKNLKCKGNKCKRQN